MKPRTSQSGFTLVDLLVCISILMICMGIAFPAFAAARASAKQASCASNMRSIWLAANLYANDGDDRYPRAKDCIDLYKPGIFPAELDVRNAPLLPDALAPYTKSKEIFHCPSDTGMEVVESLFPEPLRLLPTAYGTCGNSFEYHSALGLSPSVTTTSVQEPSAVNLLADLAGHWHGDGGAAQASDTMDDFQARAWEYRYNIIFLDGHIKLTTHDGLERAWRKS